MNILYNTLLLISIVSISFVSCKKEDSSGDRTTNSDRTYSIGDCGDFFSVGDYTNLCSISSGQPNDSLIQGMQIGGTTTCIYSVKIAPTYEIAITLNQSELSSTANINFEQTKGTYTSTTNVSGIGEKAFYTTESITDKLLVVKARNIVIQIGTYSGHCAHSDSEMELFAQNIINNLN